MAPTGISSGPDPDLRTVSLADRPDLARAVDALSAESWPPFLLHGDVRHWRSLFDRLSEDQILLCDPAGALVAAGHTAAIAWNGTLDDLPERIEDVLLRALEPAPATGGPAPALNTAAPNAAAPNTAAPNTAAPNTAAPKASAPKASAPNTLCALAAMVRRDHRGRGLSAVVVRAMLALAARRGFGTLIAPVRPAGKAAVPHVPMEVYAGWTRDDGLPFDPWIRVHRRLGAEPLRIAPATLVVTGTIREWETWTGMAFPQSGPYVVPGALQPVGIDREHDRGLYEDPNVWMRHRV